MVRADIHLHVAATDFPALLTFIDQQVADGRKVPCGAVSNALAARYRRQPPVVRQGVAVPHAAVRHLPRTRLLYALHQPPIPLGSGPDRLLHESLTLLVRYPPSPADHELLRQLEHPATQARLLPLLRCGETDAALATLRTLGAHREAGYAAGSPASHP